MSEKTLPREEESELYSFHQDCCKELYRLYMKLVDASQSNRLWAELYSDHDEFIGSTKDYMDPKVVGNCKVNFLIHENEPTKFMFNVDVVLSKDFIATLFQVVPCTLIVGKCALFFENDLLDKPVLFQVLSGGTDVAGYELKDTDDEVCLSFGYGYC